MASVPTANDFMVTRPVWATVGSNHVRGIFGTGRQFQRSHQREVSVTTFDPDFESFFVTNYDGLVRSLTAITSNGDVAQDCVQEAFVKAAARWRRLRRYDDPAAWVRRVAINRSRDWHRADNRRRKREDKAAADGAGVPRNEAAAVIESIGLAAMLQELPPRQREVVALYYIEDLPVTTIAASLRCSSGNVKFHLSKARESLRGLVEEVGFDG